MMGMGRRQFGAESQKTCHVEEKKNNAFRNKGWKSMQAKRTMLGVLVALLYCVCLWSQEMNDSLPEVVVTGTGTQHLLRTAPVQTEVISGRQLRQYGGRSLEDILSGLSASFAFNEGDMGSQMQMNGLGNNYILVLVDGKRLHGDVGGENDLSLIDPHSIEKIEIVKGAASALYGSDAIAGVVNIITKKHNEGLLVENTTRVGSYGDVRQHNGLGIGLGPIKSYTNFQLQHSDGWQNTATEWTPSSAAPITDSRSKTVNRHTNWQLSEQLTWSVRPTLEVYGGGSIYKKGIYRPKGKYPKYDVKTFDMNYENASASVGGKWRHGLTRSDTDAVTLDVDWNRHAYYHAFTSTTLAEGFDEQGQLILDFPYFEGQRALQTDQQRIMGHLKGVFTLSEAHRLSAGIEVRHDYLKAPTSIAGGTATDDTEALYVQDEWSIGFSKGHGLTRLDTEGGNKGKNGHGSTRLDAEGGNKGKNGHGSTRLDTEHTLLHVTPGLRLNRNEGFGLRLTPKLSAMLALGDLRLRASWSQGFKTPTLKERNYRYLREMTTVMLYLGNADLKPQTSNYYSLSAEYTLGRLNMSVTGYYNRLDDMITLVTIPVSNAPADYRQQYGEMLSKVRHYENMEDARTCGIDINLRYSWRDLTCGLGYSYLDTDAHVYDDSHGTLVPVTIDGMARHKGNCFVTWQHAFSPFYRMSIGLYGRMSTKRYYQNDGDGKGWQMWRLSTGHDLGHSKQFDWRVEAGIDNILNYCDRTPHGLHLGTTTPGRTVYATLTVRFHQGKQLKFTNNTKSNLKNKQQDEED